MNKPIIIRIGIPTLYGKKKAKATPKRILYNGVEISEKTIDFPTFVPVSHSNFLNIVK